MTKIEIIPSDEIVSCPDGCCHSEGYHVVDSSGDWEQFITDMPLNDLLRLVKHLLGEGVEAIVRDHD